jgi:ABC-type nickel/cobalt efflux system permease component RcnA
MDVALSAAFALGFLSGFRHAFEPDHVLAVSTLVHREPKLGRALRLGLAWGAGHTTMLMAAVLAVGLLRIQLSAELLGYFEVPVALMLLGLGAWALRDAVVRMRSLYRHRHGGMEHFHVGEHAHPHAPERRYTSWQGYLVGLVHGLAGSGALLLLVAATLPSTTVSVFYALTFGVGSILGMGAVTVALALPLIASRARPAFYSVLTGLAGVLSIVLGSGMLYAII